MVTVAEVGIHQHPMYSLPGLEWHIKHQDVTGLLVETTAAVVTTVLGLCYLVWHIKHQDVTGLLVETTATTPHLAVVRSEPPSSLLR